MNICCYGFCVPTGKSSESPFPLHGGLLHSYTISWRCGRVLRFHINFRRRCIYHEIYSLLLRSRMVLIAAKRPEVPGRIKGTWEWCAPSVVPGSNVIEAGTNPCSMGRPDLSRRFLKAVTSTTRSVRHGADSGTFQASPLVRPKAITTPLQSYSLA